MKKSYIIFFLLLLLLKCNLKCDLLYTTDGKIYDGKLVAFKFNTIYFNVYKYGKFFRSKRFPLFLVSKIDFNKPQKDKLLSSFDIESYYKKIRRGKRVVKIILNATKKWTDTGINLKIGRNVLFSVSGYIYINKKTKVFQNGELILTWNNKKPIQNQPTGAVIAKIGKNGQPFYVGNDKAPFHMSSKGRLYVGINDFNFEDNSGQFKVTIYY